MMTDVELHLKRFQKAKSRKTNWSMLYEEVLDYLAPHRQTYQQYVEGLEKNNTDKVFDSTAEDAADGFVTNIHSSLTPVGKTWISLVPGPAYDRAEHRDKKADATQKLQENTRVLFQYLKNSNFDSEIATAYFDLLIGVGSLLANKGTVENPFVFTAVHSAQVFIEEGPFGRPGTCFRYSKVAGRNIKEQWDDAELTDGMEKRIADNPDEEFCMIEMFEPVQKMEFVDLKTGEKKTRRGCWYRVISEKDKAVIVERQLRSNPLIVFRWLTMPGEVFARGPAIKALPDTKSLNKTKELILKKGSLDVVGAYTVENNGVTNIHNIRVVPGALIPVASNGGPRGRTIDALPRAGSLDVAQFVFNDLRASINKIMFAEPLGPVDAPVKTATEVAYRQKELARRMGSAFGRLMYELMVPLVNRLLDILDDLGLLPYSMEEFRIDGDVISVNYMSPLALAQNLEELDALDMYMARMVGWFGPELALGMVKPDVVAKWAAEKLNLPREFLPTDQEFEMMKQALRQRFAQQEAANAQAVPVEVMAA